MVGQKSFDSSPTGPDVPRMLAQSMESGRFVIRRFQKWEECVAFLRENQIRLLGVEIDDTAQPIEAYLDSPMDTAFLMGNEGSGLHEKQAKSCDAFVRIPQYGSGTASLNVYVAASIVLHRYHEWQRQLEG